MTTTHFCASVDINSLNKKSFSCTNEISILFF